MYLFCINLAHVSGSGPILYKKGILFLCLFCAYFVPQKCAYFVLFFGMGLRKGVFPYEYIDSLDKLNETQLPPIDKFYSKLTDEKIKQEDYNHAQKVWTEFNCKTLGDYHDLYLKTDVVLLADVFQTFQQTCMKTYKLGPLHYYTAPGLSWDALLKYTKSDLRHAPIYRKRYAWWY